ncbi:Methylenetetrahydrofolate dehydrogenase [NAD(+)] [Microbotryomycetes sp. JL221]|nr:Methylenetetrahydrofolate dehydrogenase [NAD(+)] [Microbotryomycetes sp. JL221]
MATSHQQQQQQSEQQSICATVTGEAVAKPFRAAIQNATRSAQIKPKLVGILANSSAPSKAYAQWTAKACQAVGIEYELREIKAQSSSSSSPDSQQPDMAEHADVEQAILEANEDDNVHGIMVYYPIFGPRQDSYLQQAVNPLKDVEGLNFSWLFSLYHNQRFIDPRKLAMAAQVTSNSSATTSTAASISDKDGSLVKAILPCTPLAIVKTLEHCQVYNPLLPYGSRAFGRTITVINRSEVVGRPLAALLSNDGARVFSVDLDGIQEFTKRKPSETIDSNAEKVTKPSFHPHHLVKNCKLNLKECLNLSDVVVAGVPSKEYKINTQDLKEGVVAINFSESKNFKDDIKDKASIYCPGIGKATIVLLQRNLMRLKEYQQQVKGN